MIKNDGFFMDLALAEAQRSLQKGMMPVGAIITRDGVAIARGYKTGLKNKRLDHAELMVLSDALTLYDDGSDMTLYTTLEPCLMCFATAANVKMRRIVYALEDTYGGIGNMARCWTAHGNRRWLPLIEGGVKRAQAVAQFKTFFTQTSDPFWRDQENPLVRTCFSTDLGS